MKWAPANESPLLQNNMAVRQRAVDKQAVLGLKTFTDLSFFFFPVVIRHVFGPCTPHSRSHDHIQTHHTRRNSCVRIISPKQRLLPDKTTLTRNRHPCPGGFEPTIPASERPQTHALERAATGIGSY